MAGSCISTAPAPFHRNRGVRISTYAMVGPRETANADSPIDDHKQRHKNPQWSASQIRTHGFDNSRSKWKDYCHTPRDTQWIGNQAHKVETLMWQSDDKVITSVRCLIGGTESRNRMQV